MLVYILIGKINWLDVIERSNDQYFRVVTRLTRAAAYRQNEAIADAA